MGLNGVTQGKSVRLQTQRHKPKPIVGTEQILESYRSSLFIIDHKMPAQLLKTKKQKTKTRSSEPKKG